MTQTLFLVWVFLWSFAVHGSCNPDDAAEFLAKKTEDPVKEFLRGGFDAEEQKQLFQLMGRKRIASLVAFSNNTARHELIVANYARAGFKMPPNHTLGEEEESKLERQFLASSHFQQAVEKTGMTDLPLDVQLLVLDILRIVGPNHPINFDHSLAEHLSDQLEGHAGKVPEVMEGRVRQITNSKGRILGHGGELLGILHIPRIAGTRSPSPVADLLYRSERKIVIETSVPMGDADQRDRDFETALFDLKFTLDFAKMKFGKHRNFRIIISTEQWLENLDPPYSMKNQTLYRDDTQVFLDGLPVELNQLRNAPEQPE